jgi:hypothetical protein
MGFYIAKTPWSLYVYRSLDCYYLLDFFIPFEFSKRFTILLIKTVKAKRPNTSKPKSDSKAKTNPWKLLIVSTRRTPTENIWWYVQGRSQKNKFSKAKRNSWKPPSVNTKDWLPHNKVGGIWSKPQKILETHLPWNKIGGKRSNPKNLQDWHEPTVNTKDRLPWNKIGGTWTKPK